MSHSFKVGDKVKWQSHSGHAEGKIIKVAKEDGHIEGFNYKASSDDPRYIVETEAGKKAAHKASALEKI